MKLGFTLMELMIAVAITGIVAAAAVPAYQHNAKRAYYSELVMATLPYKIAVVKCYKSKGKLSGCDGGSHNIPKNIREPISGIAALTVKDGQITVTPVAKHGLEPDDIYILTPNVHESGLIAWKLSGKAVEKGYIK